MEEERHSDGLTNSDFTEISMPNWQMDYTYSESYYSFLFEGA